MIKDIHYFEELSSTQDYAINLAKNGAVEGTLIIAKRQTKGRGRKTKSWFSPDGGLWFSLVLRPKILPLYIPKLNLCMSLAVIQAVKEIAGINVSLKWPNDVCFSERKLGGVLVEMEANRDSVQFVVIGIGLNTNLKLGDFPLALRQKVTSLQNEIGSPIDNFIILEKILENYERMYATFKRDGFLPILKDIRKNCSLLGKRVRIIEDEDSESKGNRAIEGYALDIDEDGALLIRPDSGNLKKIFSGYVEIL